MSRCCVLASTVLAAMSLVSTYDGACQYLAMRLITECWLLTLTSVSVSGPVLCDSRPKRVGEKSQVREESAPPGGLEGVEVVRQELGQGAPPAGLRGAQDTHPAPPLEPPSISPPPFGSHSLPDPVSGGTGHSPLDDL